MTAKPPIPRVDPWIPGSNIREARHLDQPRRSLEAITGAIGLPTQVDPPHDREEDTPGAGAGIAASVVSTVTITIALTDADTGDPIGEVDVSRVTALDLDFGPPMGIRRMTITY